MGVQVRPYDTAEYLKDDADIFHYLEAELELDEMPYMARALGTVIRARGSAARVAEDTGLPVGVLESATVEEGTGDRETVVKVMEAYRRRMSSASMVA